MAAIPACSPHSQYHHSQGLNVGGGGGDTAKNCIRLRPASNERSFIDFQSLLGTMLHELAHNMVSPHNVAFYKLLDELRTVRHDIHVWYTVDTSCRSARSFLQPACAGLAPGLTPPRLGVPVA